ncbi:MAG: hypothetical protein PHE67_00960 [Campylobacterales bacterium]|nr:hypothetical protein [Campylobacterales bacterium]
MTPEFQQELNENQKHWLRLAKEARERGDEAEKTFQEQADDIERIGTREYQGKASFWNMEYKNILRDVADKLRKEVHDKFLEQGLEVNGASSEHDRIVEELYEKYQAEEQKLDEIKSNSKINMVTNFKETWQQSFDGEHTMYKYEDCTVVDKGNLIQTNGKNAVIEAKASFALAIEKGWDMESVEVRGDERFKAAWQEQLFIYSQGLEQFKNEIQADKFQEALKLSQKGFQYGLNNQDVQKEGERLGIDKEMMNDAIVLENLRRAKEIDISKDAMEKITQEQAKKHIENAQSQNAEKIKNGVNEKENKQIVQCGGRER